MRMRPSSRILVSPLLAIVSQMSSFPLAALAAPQTQRVLSIQSHTVHGFVGNKAATFPLQCLGFDVNAINTVSLSNEPSYAGGCKGKSLLPEDVLAIIDGLDANDLLKYDLVITGYTRSLEVAEETAKAIKRVITANPRAVYVMDPVLGDDGEFYVPSELTDFFKRNLLPMATAITPNQFEAEVLSGVKITSLATAKEACNVFHALGPRICLLKGLTLNENDTNDNNDMADKLSIVLSVAGDEGMLLRMDVPKLSGRFSGCGDLFTAVSGGLLCKYIAERENKDSADDFKHHKWSTSELAEILERTVEVMNEVLKSTRSTGSMELRIVESIDAYRTAALPPLTSRKVIPDKITVGGIMVDDIMMKLDDGNPIHMLSSYIASGPVTGVIFDMDGTLTMPGAIDFNAMYTRTGLIRGEDLITQINLTVDPILREKLNKIIIEEEMYGCDRMIVRSDLTLFLKALHERRIRAAISTRNCEPAIEKFLDLAVLPTGRFFPLVHRETLGGINKPDPKVARHILDIWSSPPETVWFVGDSDDDMKCGKAAGCKTCLILTDYNRKFKDDRKLVDLAVDSLSEFGRHIGLNIED